MKITLNQEKLARALNYTSRAVSIKPNIPVLSNILLEVTKTELRLSATNLDMGINMWIAGGVDSEGKTTASGKFLSDFINAATGDKVNLFLDKDTLRVETADSKAEFQTIASGEFPILPKASGEPFMTVARGDLISALEKVIFACAADVITSRVQFTGVLFSLSAEDPDQLILVGLDSFRLSHKTIKVDRQDKAAHELIVPARSLQELVKIMSAESEEEQVEIYLSESKSQLIFKFAEVEFSVRLLEGPYPDYQRVMPKEAQFSFEVEKSELERGLKIVNTFARSVQGKKVNFDLDLESATLTLHSEVTDLGQNQTKIPVKNTSGSSDLQSAFSLDFLIDMVNHMSGSSLHFQTQGPLKAAVFTDKTDKNYLHLVMPLQRDL